MAARVLLLLLLGVAIAARPAAAAAANAPAAAACATGDAKCFCQKVGEAMAGAHARARVEDRGSLFLATSAGGSVDGGKPRRGLFRFSFSLFARRRGHCGVRRNVSHMSAPSTLDVV
jgi:hypothetical protein